MQSLGGLERGMATVIGDDDAMATVDDGGDRIGGFASGNPLVPWACLFLVKDSTTGNYMQQLMPRAPDLFVFIDMLFLFCDVCFVCSFFFVSFFFFFPIQSGSRRRSSDLRVCASDRAAGATTSACTRRCWQWGARGRGSVARTAIAWAEIHNAC